MKIKKCGVLYFFMAVLVMRSVSASTWIGPATDGDWNNADNWDGGVPVAGGTAEFNSSVHITSDITLSSGKITLLVSAGKTLDLDGVISGSGALDVGIKGNAATGTVNFNNSNTFTGNLKICAGEMHAKADGAFGLSTTGSVQCGGGILVVDGVEILREINIDDLRHVFNDGSILGKLTQSAQVRFRVNGHVEWTGGGGNGTSLWMPTVTANSELVIKTTKVSILPYLYGFAGKVILDVANCNINNYTGNGSCYSWTRIAYCIRCDVNNAISENSNLCFEDVQSSDSSASGKSCLDLNSTTQSVKRLYSKLTAAQMANSKYVGVVSSTNGGLITVNTPENFTNCNSFVGTASFALNQAAGKTAVISGKSTSSGELIALSTGSVILTSSAQWAGSIRVCEGSSVSVESGDVLTPTTTLSLEGGTLTLPDNTTIFVKAVRQVTGEYLTTGFHKIDGITGLVGNNVTLVVNAPVEAEPSVNWTWQGGHGTSVRTLANWKDATALPDFNYPGNVFIIPSGAEVCFDVDALAKQLVIMSAGQEAVTQPTRISTTEEGTGLSLFFGGMIVSSNQQVEVTMPINYYGGLGIDVGAKSMLCLNGKVAGLKKNCDVYKWGAGSFWIKGDDNNFANGNMVLSNGLFYVTGAAPLGGLGTLYHQALKANCANTALLLSNAVVSCTYTATKSNNKSIIRGCAASTNKCTGKVYLADGFFMPKADGDGCVFEIATTRFGSSSMLWYATGEGAADPLNSTSYFKLTTPLQNLPAHYYQESPSASAWKTMLEIACSSNILCTSTSTMPAQPPFEKYGCFIYGTRLAANDAIHPWVQLALQGVTARIDLGGYTQHLYNLIISGVTKPAGSAAATDPAGGLTGCIYGKAGSRLVLTGTPICTDTAWDGVSINQLPNFGGAASFERAGTGTNTFRCVNTSTGEVAVTGGELIFAKKGDTWKVWSSTTSTSATTPVDATWAGRKAIVTGGSLVLRHAKVFPKDAELYVGDGAVELTAKAAYRFANLYVKVGDEWKRLSAGRYGAVDNTSIKAEHRLNCLSGAGTVYVGTLGTALFVR